MEQLKSLSASLNEEGNLLLQQDIKKLEYGMIGEKNIAFELKNSHMPMYILHDVYLEDGDLSSQIDYLVFTKKLCFVIECKNLYGNIEINHMGDFIRTIEFGGKKKKEGVYSPITQNQRHLELMKKIKSDSRSNILTKFLTDRYFEDAYQPVVVLANPKTVLYARFAKPETREQVIRADQLVKYIKETCEKSKEPAVGTVEMHWEYTEVFKALKAYRLHKSREEKIKPYMIFSDRQLKDLLTKMPKSKDALQTVYGFGVVKADKYGADILKIVQEYQNV